MKKPGDERVVKQWNKVYSKCFWVYNLLLVVLLALKLSLRRPISCCALELLCLVVGFGVVLVRGLMTGTLFPKEKDEALRDIWQEILSKAAYLEFSLLIFGELVVFLLRPQEPWECVPYVAVWFVPTLVVSVYAIKHGLLLWGGKKKAEKGKSELAKRTALGALFFGVIAGLPMIFEDGVFHPEKLLVIPVMGASWGILFYLLMVAVINIGEKAADKQVKEAENAASEEGAADDGETFDEE